MKITTTKMSVGILVFGLLGVIATALRADPLDPALQVKIDAQLKEAQTWAADAAIVNAVKAHNAKLPADQAVMTQDKWKALSVLDPFVRAFTKNEAGEFLKTHKSEIVSEAFVSGADGLKVAFLARTSNWSHKGKPKHDVPMTGKTWQGTPELDESTGLLQIQVAVPVLDSDKPIGSLVIGVSPSRLKD